MSVKLRIDEGEILRIIEERSPKKVALSGPEGFTDLIISIAHKLEKRYDLPVHIVVEPNYGVCDIEVDILEKLDADLLFNIGHALKIRQLDSKIFLINVEYDVKFDDVVWKAIPKIKSYKARKIGVFTVNNHISSLSSVIKTLRSTGFIVVEPEEDLLLLKGQVLGCNYVGPYSIKDKVDVFLFLGQSRFHAAGIYLTTKKPTLMLDPFFNEVLDVSEEGRRIMKRAFLSLLKSKMGKRFGIVTGLRGSQLRKAEALEIKEKLKELGKEADLLVLREIRPEALNRFKEYDAFVVLACPRIALDDLGYNKPILSYLQACALVKLLKGEEVHELFEESIWR